MGERRFGTRAVVRRRESFERLRRRIRPRWALASAAAECRNATRIDSAGVRAAVKYLVPHETLGGIRGFRFLLHRRRGVGGGGHGERARPE